MTNLEYMSNVTPVAPRTRVFERLIAYSASKLGNVVQAVCILGVHA